MLDFATVTTFMTCDRSQRTLTRQLGRAQMQPQKIQSILGNNVGTWAPSSLAISVFFGVIAYMLHAYMRIFMTLKCIMYVWGLFIRWARRVNDIWWRCKRGSMRRRRFYAMTLGLSVMLMGENDPCGILLRFRGPVQPVHCTLGRGYKIKDMAWILGKLSCITWLRVVCQADPLIHLYLPSFAVESWFKPSKDGSIHPIETNFGWMNIQLRAILMWKPGKFRCGNIQRWKSPIYRKFLWRKTWNKEFSSHVRWRSGPWGEDLRPRLRLHWRQRKWP